MTDENFDIARFTAIESIKEYGIFILSYLLDIYSFNFDYLLMVDNYRAASESKNSFLRTGSSTNAPS